MANQPLKRQMPPVKAESFPAGVKKQKVDDHSSSASSDHQSSSSDGVSEMNPLDDEKVLRFQRRAMYLTIAEKNRLIDSLQRSVDQSVSQCSRSESRLLSMVELFDGFHTDAQILLDRVAPSLHQSKPEQLSSTSPSDAILRLLQIDGDENSMEDEHTDNYDSEWTNTLHAKRSRIQSIFHNVLDILQTQTQQPIAFDSLTSTLEKQHREDSKLLSSMRASLATTEQKLFESEQKTQALQDELKKVLRQRDRFELDHSMAQKALESAESQIGKNSTMPSSSPKPGAHSSPRASPDNQLMNSSQLDETRVALADMTAEKEELQTKLNSVNEELRVMRTQRDEARTVLDQRDAAGLSDEAILASHQYRSLLVECNKFKNEVESLSASVDHSAHELAEQKALNEKDRAHFKQQIDRLTKAFQEKDDSMSQMVAEAREARVNAERERDAAVEAKAAISNAETEAVLSHLRSLVGKMQKELQEANNAFTAYEALIDPKQRKFIHSERHWFSLFHHKQQQWRKLEAFLISQLNESQLGKVRQEGQSLDSILNVDLNRALDGEFVDDSGLTDELDELAASQTELNERLAKALVSVAETERQRQIWREEKLDATTQASLVRTEILALKHNVRIKSDEIDKLQNANLSLSNQVRALEDAARAKDIALSTAHQSLKEVKKNVDELTANLDKSRIELQSAQKSLSIATSKIADVHSRCSELENKLSNQKRSITELRADKDRLNDQIQKLQKHQSSSHSHSNGATGDELFVVKRRLKCSVCSKHDKDTVITKCWHLFCHGCVEENLTTRNRKCPGCKTKFDKNDVQRVYGLE